MIRVNLKTWSNYPDAVSNNAKRGIELNEKVGKRYKATTWDCTPPGHEDAYTLRRTEWELLPEVANQMQLF